MNNKEDTLFFLNHKWRVEESFNCLLGDTYRITDEFHPNSVFYIDKITNEVRLEHDISNKNVFLELSPLYYSIFNNGFYSYSDCIQLCNHLMIEYMGISDCKLRGDGYRTRYIWPRVIPQNSNPPQY